MASPAQEDSDGQRKVYQAAARLHAAMQALCHPEHEKRWSEQAASETKDALKLAAEDRTVRHVPRLLIAAQQALVVFPGTLEDIEPDSAEVEQDVWYKRRNRGRALTPPLDTIQLGDNQWWTTPPLLPEDDPGQEGDPSCVAPATGRGAQTPKASTKQKKRKLGEMQEEPLSPGPVPMYRYEPGCVRCVRRGLAWCETSLNEEGQPTPCHVCRTSKAKCSARFTQKVFHKDGNVMHTPTGSDACKSLRKRAKTGTQPSMLSQPSASQCEDPSTTNATAKERAPEADSCRDRGGEKRQVVLEPFHELLRKEKLNKQIDQLRSEISELKQSLDEERADKKDIQHRLEKERRARVAMDKRLNDCIAALEHQEAVVLALRTVISQSMRKLADTVADPLQDPAERRAKLPSASRRHCGTMEATGGHVTDSEEEEEGDM
ncbi:hypothetical protein ID866_5022 [Astraeus odoratus]|nr:hypothetical protein ID866_5022 [Astraeus odoratus]